DATCPSGSLKDINHWRAAWSVLTELRMSQVKQVGLLAAGCQPWNKDVCDASGDRFAYCATLAIYIYQLDQQYNEFKLRSIMSEHKKTITAISWSPDNPDLFASASADNLLIVWNVAEQKAVARLDNTKGIPASVSWCWNSTNGVAFVSHRGPLYIWVYGGADPGVTVHKEAHSFLSDICLFRWHPTKKCKLVFGHTDGSLSIFQPEGSDEEDPVTALEWDPLSTDYLLVSNLHNGIRLVDSEGLTCITSFCFPSAAASVQCLAWVPSAPGLFITGDSQVGVLRIWNVSRSTPLDNIKLKKTGFHALHVLNSPPAKKALGSNSPNKSQYTSSTSEAVPPPTLSQNQSFSLPPGHAVCCFMDGGVGLYDMGAKKWDFLRDLHGKNGIFCISWSHKDSKRIATCSGDGFCIIRTIDGKVLHKYKHPAAVFGCDWSQNNNTVRIWDYTQDACINVLSGHTAPVRGLLWNTEVPYLLTSGSWDYTIRVWDTRDGRCLDTVYDHGADVYGLTCHPSRPFTMASCSRDSTVRLWSLTPLISPLLLNILTQQPWDRILGNTDRAMVPGSPPLLCGKVSRDIKQELDKLTSDARPPGGSNNLWDLVSVINGQDDSLLPPSYSKGSDAQELTIVKMSKFGGGIGAPSKEERLKEAADIHLRLGQIQRYCELMWDKALSVAPGVSMKYWKKLMQRGRGQLKEALLVVQGACEGNIHAPCSSVNNHSSKAVDNKQQYQSLLRRVCTELAEWYFQDGCCVLAACCHLAVDNIELALSTLIRGNELELAVCVGDVLGEAARKSTAYCLELLARKYMTAPTWELSADLLHMIPDNTLLLSKLCAFYPGTPAESNSLHERCGLPPLEECKNLAEESMSEGDLFSAVKFYLLCDEPQNALSIGLQHIRARSELLILCGYIGALLAIRRQYSSIVSALYEYT
ncbi:hypothetical protein CRUP_024254, partial [Coryphaenoides rupestris]